MDTTLSILVFLAAIATGTVGGIFYGFSSFVMKALRRVAPEQGVAAMNSINIVVINASFMLAFMGATLLCLVLAAGSPFWWEDRSGTLVLTASLLYLGGVFGVTTVVNQPMNLHLGKLPPTDALAYWPEYVTRWTRWNHVRTGAALGAMGLFVYALVGR
jgi:uncharacterized membrane protein